MERLSLNSPMPLYGDVHLVGIGDTRLGNNEPWEITDSPITVAIVADDVMSDRLGEKW